MNSFAVKDTAFLEAETAKMLSHFAKEAQRAPSLLPLLKEGKDLRFHKEIPISFVLCEKPSFFAFLIFCG
jgi:hypothetical protein